MRVRGSERVALSAEGSGCSCSRGGGPVGCPGDRLPYPHPACVRERGSRRVRQSIRPAERFLLCARGESGLSSSVRRQEEVAFAAAAAAVVVGGGGVHGGHRAQEVWALTCLNPTR